MWQHRLTAAIITVLVLGWTTHGQAQNVPPPIPADEQPEVLTRGPVHEAFAEPVSLQSEVGLVAPSQPPDNIDEIPPADRPAGDQFVWVPGYWSWDGDRNNYIWVSACWRSAPPNMSWVPGYWSQVSGGWEWVAGFWAPAGAQEIEYLPAPPASDAVEAPGPPPAVDNVWVPACWYWSEGHYIQRRGYWLAAQAEWVWVASHYVWTPRGYVFAEGHWDYPLEDRGVLFAPVYISAASYGRRGYTYSPSVVVDIDVLSLSLFVSPRYSHYYFGDYYDDAYIQVGIYPWFDRNHIPAFYDPIYEYDRARFSRTEPRWEENERHEYDVRRADKDLRPPRTYREMEARVAKAPEPQRKRLQVVQPLTVVVNNTTNNVTNTRITNTNTNTSTHVSTARNGSAVKFEKISPQTKTQIAKQTTDVKKFRDDRKGWESAASEEKAVPPVNSQKAPVVRPTAPKEPVAAPPAERRVPAVAPASPPIPAAPPAERKEPAVQPPNRKPAASPPRQVRAAQPEKVKIPAQPLVGKAKAAADKGPPPKPADEVKRKADAKDTPKKDDASDPAPAGGRGRRGD